MKRGNVPRDVPKRPYVPYNERERTIEVYDDTIDEVKYRVYKDGVRTLMLVLGEVGETT